MNQSDDYRSLSTWYDTLATIALYGCIKRSQRRFLEELPQSGSLLIIGGGTGWILKDIYKIRPKVKITYVDSSESMINRSKRTVSGLDLKLSFKKGKYSEMAFDEEFDAIISNFYLDLFAEESLAEEVEKIKSILSQEGKWLVADFQVKGKGLYSHYQKGMIQLIIGFFRIMTEYLPTQLPKVREALLHARMNEVRSAHFNFGLIFSAVYEK